jgi:hemoglobin
MHRATRLTLLALAAWLAACAADPQREPTLFTRLGGNPVIAAVVTETIDRSVADARTRRSFEGVKLARVKEKFIEQVCALAGGPCRYSGDPMDVTHKGLKITAAEFDLLVQFLREALDRARVGEAEKNELLRLLAPMRRDIVSA